MSSARLFVISAPSGCGKGTLIAELNKDFSVYNSISCTTRKPRDGEIDGVHYHFVTRKRFKQLIESDGFLEYASFAGNYYGTPRSAVEESLSNGKDVILEIEPQGALQVKKKCPDAVMLFILPTSVASLDRRLHRRAKDSGETEEMIQKRLATAKGDIKCAYKYDYVMINGELNAAVSDIKKIYKAAKEGGELSAFAAENMKDRIDEVLKNA